MRSTSVNIRRDSALFALEERRLRTTLTTHYSSAGKKEMGNDPTKVPRQRPTCQRPPGPAASQEDTLAAATAGYRTKPAAAGVIGSSDARKARHEEDAQQVDL